MKRLSQSEQQERQELIDTCVDRNGAPLRIGDKVIYINARYGAGASLDYGVVEDFKFYRRRSRRRGTSLEVHVRIKNEGKEEMSTITKPSQSIMKTEY